MEVRLTVTAGHDGGQMAEAVITAPEGARLGHVAGTLRRVVGGDGDLWCGGVRLTEETALGQPPLVAGAVVTVGAAAAPPRPAGQLQLRVVGGPDAGGVHLIGRGSALVGRGDEADVRLDDPDLSRRHAELTVTSEAVTVRDLGSTNGSALDRRPLGADATPFLPDSMLRLGESLLTLVVDDEPLAAAMPDGEGYVDVNRPPRLRPRLAAAEVTMPRQPRPRDTVPLPVLAMVLPMLLTLPMVLVAGRQMLMLMLLSPVMLAGNHLSDRMSGRRSQRKEMARYERANAAAQEQIARALAAEVRLRRRDAPDPAALLLTAFGPGARLWERRRDDADALSLRMGVADLPSRITICPPATAQHEQTSAPAAADVPVVVSLLSAGVVGIAGPRRRVEALSRWLVAQLAGLHSPRDLELVLLCSPGSSRAWRWARWLPHLRPTSGQQCSLLLGLNTDQVTARVAELVARLETRLAMERLGRSRAWTGPNAVVLLDGSRQLRALPGVARLLEHGPTAGIHAICLADDPAALPAECNATAVVQGDVQTRLLVSVAGEPPVANAIADLVSESWAELFGRALAPLRDATPEGGESMLPAAVRLLDLVHLDPPSPEAVAARWIGGRRSTSAVIGVARDGPFAVDIRGDGPHGLVAGTTGAGKSELLQTLIASLAVDNRPDELSFVLVDYKGGAAFQDCVDLPHTVGMVTDLDGHLTERALRSLDAELKRRERLLREAGCKDVEEYREAGSPLAPLGRLVIVIDEFATLALDLPEFVSGLVDVARRGRSLGVHLVLATQRPGGVVSADIRANTNLRIALRVTDPTESQDVIECKDAALISRTTPGRAYLRTGAGAVTPVQCARVGGRKSREHPVPTGVVPISWETLGDPPLRATVAEEDGPTDLALLVQAVRGAADQLGVTPPPSPWLPPLNARVTVTDLPPSTMPGQLPVGLIDVPSRQTRGTFVIDLEHGGHWLVAGGPRSGRSTLLRTIAGVVARDCAVPDVHVYALDCASGSLLPLAALPHCGAVVTRDQPVRGARVISRLVAEVSRRQDLLGRHGFGSVAEQRAAAPPEQRLPWLVLLLDGWEGFLAAYETVDHGRPVDALLRLLREGPAVGLRAVLTGDRGLLTGPVTSLIPGRLILRMPDPMDFSLAGIATREVPETMPPGRGLLLSGEGVQASQVALLSPDPAGPAQVAALQRLGASALARAGDVPRERRPFSVRELPSMVRLGDVLVDAEGVAAGCGPLWTLVGVGGDELDPLGWDMALDGPAFVVAGPPRSGRSTALVAMARWYAARGVPVVVVTPRRSPLRDLGVGGADLGVGGADLGVGGSDLGVGGADVGGVRAGRVVGQFGTAEADACELLALFESHRGPLAVLVDDAEALLGNRVEAVITETFLSGHDDQRGLVVAGSTEEMGSTYRGLTVAARKGRCGLLLGPTGPLDGDLLGVKITPATEVRPGRGVLAIRGVATPVQTPLP